MKDCRRYVIARKSLGLASNSPGQILRPAEKGIQLAMKKNDLLYTDIYNNTTP